ncbi:MAG: hypothetical protein HZA08_13095 [Nitrospirae bacterium]|nr:hypothetical protein [Nitrospirota bacterium]
MKRIVSGLIIGVFIISLTASAWAGDSLLKTLQKKGVISEEEYVSLLAEQQKEAKSNIPKALDGLSIGGVAFIDYSIGTKDKNGTDYNRIVLTRGYINIKKDITPWLKVRITPDVTQITKTSNSQYGDLELRMKYYYADFLLTDGDLFTENVIRVGLAQIPWIDFLENINTYRMQGSQFQERFGNINSADIGISLIGNFGGKLSRETQEEVGYSTPYSGKYGGYYIGIYNGSGYNAVEENMDKVVEGRITLRPLPNLLPGLQLSYFGVNGKGNKSAKPDWQTHTGLLSFQNKYMVLTGEYAEAKGNQKGEDEKDKRGFSLFGDFKIPFTNNLNFIARYDEWDPDAYANNDEESVMVGGLSYRLSGNNTILADYEVRGYRNPADTDDHKGQLVYQLSF